MGTFDEFAPVAPSGSDLLARGLKERNDEAQPLDVQHVLLAFDRYPWSVRDLADYPAITRLLTDATAMIELRGALRYTLLPPTLGTPQRSIDTGPLTDIQGYQGTLSPSLRRCLASARASWPTASLNDAMIIYAILNDQNFASGAVRALEGEHPGLSVDKVIREVEIRAQREMSVAHPNGVHSPDRSVYMPTLMSPHHEFQHVVRHRELMRQIADEVSACDPGQFVLVSGLNGSPLHYVKHIIADALADPSIQDQLPFANTFSGAWIGDLAKFKRWSNPPVVSDAEHLLLEGIQHVANNGGILFLEHAEVLAEASDFARELLGLLLVPVPRSAVVALYEQRGIALTSPLDELGLAHDQARLIEIDPYDAGHALASLREFYVPEWEQHGYVFAGDVTDARNGPFQDILALVDGAQVERAHTNLPYLLVEVAQTTFKQDKNGILNCAKRARSRVEPLRTSAGQQGIPAQVVTYYELRLTSTLQQVAEAENAPEFAKQRNKAVITRAHLTTVFLGSLRSKFEYPQGITPQ